MKKLKMILWITTILVIGLVFIQNQAFSMAEQRLSLNLLLFKIALPPLSNGAILLLFFFGGILLSATSSMIGRLKTRKALKRCTANGDDYIHKIGVLKTQLDQMKNRNTPKTAVKPSVIAQASGRDHAVA